MVTMAPCSMANVMNSATTNDDGERTMATIAPCYTANNGTMTVMNDATTNDNGERTMATMRQEGG